jgi:hypothetical protein
MDHRGEQVAHSGAKIRGFDPLFGNITGMSVTLGIWVFGILFIWLTIG